MTMNDFDINEYLTRSIIFVPIILGIVQALKMSALPEKYAPILSLVIGIIIAFVAGDGFDNWGHNTLGGLVYGLSACGLWDIGTMAVNARKETKK
jgi:uncharacterized membrane protein (DUF441 family)